MPNVTAQLRADASIASTTESVMARVRKEPGRAELRVLLFQLFCLGGVWERALAQLAAAARLDPEHEEMARVYREVIRCEVLRGQVFAGRKAPLLLGLPAPWLASLLEAARLNADGQPERAAALRAGAYEAAPVSAGSVDGAAFGWLADADSRLGPVLEAIVNGKYYWIAYEQLARVEIEAPADLRDLVWIPATLTFVNGGRQVAFLPSRYPGSEAGGDDLALARRTEWRELGAGSWAGMGQRMLSSELAEYALLEVRTIEFARAAAADGADDDHG